MNASTVPNHHADYPGFSGISGYLAGLTMLAGRRRVARLAADVVNVVAADRLVDVGCGPGVPAREAARRGATVAAVDPAVAMLNLGRRLTRRDALIRWLTGSAEAVPVPDDWATVFWSLSAVHHWADVDRGLREARRVLAPSGRLLAIERRIRPGGAGHASHGWTDAQAQAFADRCRIAGFDDARIEIAKPHRHSMVLVRAVAPTH